MLSAGLFGLYLPVVVDIGDTARDEANKDFGRTRVLQYVCYMDLWQHGIIARVHDYVINPQTTKL